jgi:hypothetical protein
VVGDQPAQHGIGVLGVAQVLGAIELMQTGGGEAGGVADVVQPRGGFQETGVRAENRCQAACPGGDALDVCPAAGRGSWRSARASCSPHDASVVMRPRSSRLMTSCRLVRASASAHARPSLCAVGAYEGAAHGAKGHGVG